MNSVFKYTAHRGENNFRIRLYIPQIGCIHFSEAYNSSAPSDEYQLVDRDTNPGASSKKKHNELLYVDFFHV